MKLDKKEKIQIKTKVAVASLILLLIGVFFVSLIFIAPQIGVGRIIRSPHKSIELIASQNHTHLNGNNYAPPMEPPNADYLNLSTVIFKQDNASKPNGTQMFM